MEDFVQFASGAVVALVVLFFVVRNQVRKHEELRQYVEQLEAGARAYSDELWDEVKATQVKVAEMLGKLSK